MLANSEFLPSEKEFFDFLKIRFATVGVDFDELNQLGIVEKSMQVSERRFSRIKTKYFVNTKNGNARFSATHYSGHALVLYQIARECFLSKRSDLAERIYFLNIATTTSDLHYEIDLPLRTGCDHPLGTVIGRADFSRESKLFFNQQCTIGGNFDLQGHPKYPKVDGLLFLHPKSSLVGENHCSGIVILANSTYVKNLGAVQDCLIFGESPNLIFKPLTKQIIANHSFFN
jgi:serine O-acetyltransferase